jgi:hypothetical protein
MSSDSPSKEPDVADTAQSGEEQDQEMSREEPQGLGDFEVKEQDRWLPIANGWSRFICILRFVRPLRYHLRVCVFGCGIVRF